MRPPKHNLAAVPRDLAVELYNLLHQKSAEHAERWRCTYIETRTQSTLNEQQQIQSLNQFWRYELGALDDNTLQARSALCDAVSADVWLANFKKYVLPTIVKHTCPIQTWIHQYA